MSDSAEPKPTAAPPARLQAAAAIDVGSNLIRMSIANVLDDDRIEIVDNLQRAVRLGQDTFRRGRLGGQVMRAAIAVLRDFRRQLDSYRIDQVRVVATSAVREAANADAFLDRVVMATGLEIEVIDTTEESRLTVSAVLESIRPLIEKRKDYHLIAEVGGGNTLLTVLRGSEIVAAQSLPLGSIRLLEALSLANEPPERAAEILALRIDNEIEDIGNSLPWKQIHSFVSLGGDVRFAARQIGGPSSLADLTKVSRSALRKLIRDCQLRTPEELAHKYGLSFSQAETLNPALLVYQALVRSLHIRWFWVCPKSLRDGLLLDLARRITGRESEALTEGVIQSTLSIARKYRVDLDHSGHVEQLAGRLFDELQGEHGLSRRYRLLLRVAALLHETGNYVNNRAHHKHSFYLINNAEIFGISRDERTVVALAARYHRRGGPKPTHPEYIHLGRERRMIISKLAALLRVADALDAGHSQQVRLAGCQRGPTDLVLLVSGAADLSLERRSLAIKGDLFEDIFGMKIRLEEISPHWDA